MTVASPTPMNLGTPYYRDPNPPERFWRKDLADIRAAGFAFIGVWIPWRYVNPELAREDGKWYGPSAALPLEGFRCLQVCD